MAPEKLMNSTKNGDIQEVETAIKIDMGNKHKTAIRTSIITIGMETGSILL